MGEYPSNEGINEGVNGTVKDITNIIKKASTNTTGDIIGNNTGIDNVGENTEYSNINNENIGYNKTGWKVNGTNNETVTSEETNTTANTFKVAKSNLPVKVGFWTKVRNVLLSEIKVELTPYQQKIEDEINEFLHQEVTWQSFKNFLFQEVPITYKGKRIF